VWVVLGHEKKRKRVKGGALEDDGALPFCRGQGGRPGMAGGGGK
jgi:hypothetical protein